MIGRKREVEALLRLHRSRKAELVAVYGRRRVGKTYLVTETFRNKLSFHHAGLSPVDGDKSGSLKAQLEQFYYSLLMQGMERSHRPASWLEAFFMLEKLLESKDDGQRQVVFLDELPWLDTPRSGFMTAFEGFWNNWGCYRPNLMVIVCGSSSTWILNKLINNHGGLYNRVTYQLKLAPFTLGECESFFNDSHVRMSRYDIAQSHMIFGGIPYYLGYFEGGLSLPQNIDKLLFANGGALQGEYDRLFSSVFSRPESKKTIVGVLASRSSGFTRKEIAQKLGVTEGGRLSENLQALIAGDFVVKYVPFGYSKRDVHYKLVDPFCIFWQRFMDGHAENDDHFWQNSQATPAAAAWKELAFEQTCFNHIEQIKAALGIQGVTTRHSAWSKRDDERGGAQIDLILERNDNVLNSCEIKFSGNEFKVDGDYYRTLLHRQELLMGMVSPKTAIHNTLITTYGLAYNEYSGVFANVVTLDQLFA